MNMKQMVGVSSFLILSAQPVFAGGILGAIAAPMFGSCYSCTATGTVGGHSEEFAGEGYTLQTAENEAKGQCTSDAAENCEIDSCHRTQNCFMNAESMGN